MLTTNFIAAEAAPVTALAPSQDVNAQDTQTENTGANLSKSNQSPYGTIEQLAAERLAWQEGAFRTSNEQLYEILKNCYQLYLGMCGNKETSSLLRDSLVKYIAENNIIVKESAHTMTKIVRCVFGNDRRRVSAYSIVLRAAFALDIKANDLPSYIRENGGVEEVRLAKSLNYVSPKQKAQTASTWLDKANLAVINSKTLADQLDAAKVGCQHVLIVTHQADGSLIANAIVSNQTVVTSALAAYYSANKLNVENSKVVTNVTNSQEKLTASINQAATLAV